MTSEEAVRPLSREEMLKSLESLKTHAFVLFADHVNSEERNWIGNSIANTANDFERYIAALEKSSASEQKALAAIREKVEEQIKRIEKQPSSNFISVSGGFAKDVIVAQLSSVLSLFPPAPAEDDPVTT